MKFLLRFVIGMFVLLMVWHSPPLQAKPHTPLFVQETVVYLEGTAKHYEKQAQEQLRRRLRVVNQSYYSYQKTVKTKYLNLKSSKVRSFAQRTIRVAT